MNKSMVMNNRKDAKGSGLTRVSCVLRLCRST
jgi:hypothetical protein